MSGLMALIQDVINPPIRSDPSRPSPERGAHGGVSLPHVLQPGPGEGAALPAHTQVALRVKKARGKSGMRGRH